MKSQLKSITSKTKLLNIVNMTSGSTHEEASVVSLDDLDNISILLYEVDDLEEKFTDLLNEVSIIYSNHVP